MILRTWQEHQWFYIWHHTPAACWGAEKLFHFFTWLHSWVRGDACITMCVQAAPHKEIYPAMSQNPCIVCYDAGLPKIIRWYLTEIFSSVNWVLLVNRDIYLMYIGRTCCTSLYWKNNFSCHSWTYVQYGPYLQFIIE